VRGEFIIDITAANRRLDEQRRVIAEVSRRCLLKGKPYDCRDCPVFYACDAKLLKEQEEHHARQYGTR
jgi:hypothetical protein